MAKVKMIIHACPACDEKEHGQHTGLEFVDTNDDGKTILVCTNCGWTGLKAECVPSERVEDQQ